MDEETPQHSAAHRSQRQDGSRWVVLPLGNKCLPDSIALADLGRAEDHELQMTDAADDVLLAAPSGGTRGTVMPLPLLLPFIRLAPGLHASYSPCLHLATVAPDHHRGAQMRPQSSDPASIPCRRSRKRVLGWS